MLAIHKLLISSAGAAPPSPVKEMSAYIRYLHQVVKPGTALTPLSGVDRLLLIVICLRSRKTSFLLPNG